MVMFGSGRVFLLDLIEKHGSLRKAAQLMGMSYRAAWGKLKASEKALGVKLIETPARKCDGCRLSAQGRMIRDKFKAWFQAVEREALSQADEIFPWGVSSFEEARREAKKEDRPAGE